MRKYLMFVFVLLMQGCASYGSKKEAFHQHFNVGNFEEASKVMYTKADTPNLEAAAKSGDKKSEGEVLPSDFSDLGSMKFFIGLNGGTAAMYSHKYKDCDALFGVAEECIVTGDTDGYNPKYYEKVMLNTYRALALLQAGDVNNAKVEFNRASASQSEAVRENKKEISKLKEEASQKEYAQNVNVAKGVLDNEYKEFENFKPYADFANPYASYINGLFLTLNGSKSDIENGILDLKRAKSMVPDNKFIKSDIQMAENLANHKSITPTIWVVYEDGLISEIEKQHFAIPFIINGNVKLAHMALPKMVPMAAAYPSIQVSANKKMVSSQSIVDMDRVMKTEFKNRYPAEVAKAVIWMTVNLVAQEAAQQALGKDNQGWGAVAALAIGAVSNPVEVRTWSSLPKNIQIARIAMPKNRKIQLFDSEGKAISQEIEIEKGINQALVYVRIPTIAAVPAVSVTKLK